MSNFLSLTDFYKVDHRRQYPTGTTMVYSNFTPRASRVKDQNAMVHFGLQYFLQRYLHEEANRSFFNLPQSIVVDDYKRLVDSGLGPNDVGTDHIAALHRYGCIPLRFFSLPEGTHVPLRCPAFVFHNTHPDFFWMTNYIETPLSSVIWPMSTSATTAMRYRKLLDNWASDTGGDASFVPFQGHDFSFRGMMGPEAAAMSGAGHLCSFTGTDTLPAIELVSDYYHGGQTFVGGSVAATEHSVMCAGGKDTEIETYSRLLDLYPKGVVSVVSDTWDLWAVIDQILPQLKDKIMAREGKLVIRPDSGDPVDILCGHEGGPWHSAVGKGVVERLWDHFGGTVNAEDFKQLDSHIGAIYGDSITEDRANRICSRLAQKGFASTNVVLGIGSFTYQYVTRDTYGNAIKATMCFVKGEERQMFKDPVTDDGVKKSLRGCIRVKRNNKLAGDGAQQHYAVDGLTYEEAHGPGAQHNELREVWRDGSFVRRQTITEIRDNILEG